MASKQYTQAPALVIDPNKQYTAHFHTNKGDFDIQLFAKAAPLTVNYVVFLALAVF